MEKEEFEMKVLVELSNIHEKLNQLVQRKLVQQELVQPAIKKMQETPIGYRPKPKRQMFPAVCSICNMECEVPFEPNYNSKIRCKSCYAKGL